jgi:hypothetical protein
MAVIYQQTMPEGTPIEMLDEVTDEMGVDRNPPEGLLVHTHFDDGGQVRIVDVWESQDAFEKFNAERLGPAVQKVAQARGVDMSEGPGPVGTMTKVHRVVRGA